jgi:hypothetical protein
VEMLLDEVRKRSQIRWEVVHAWPRADQNSPVIAIGRNSDLSNLLGAKASSLAKGSPANLAEGYQLRTGRIEDMPAILVSGNDSRGVLFGIGKLLRSLEIGRQRIVLPQPLAILSTPTYPIRGHQLGYRPKTNSYDGWDLPQWEQYIRDLAVFGCNSVELIPPRSDDAPDSPHFSRPQMEMMTGMSRILDDYGLDVWIWYPALDADYTNPATVEFALKEWAKVFKRLPRVDAVFVPGGDPGATQPKVLLALLEKQSANLHRFHPKAQMWVSPQGFSSAGLDEFCKIINEQKPAWLTGVVHGPQVRVSVAELRRRIPEPYKIRLYPDITHSLRCQFPVPDWDLAYALTEAREVINPRPEDQSLIFHAIAKPSAGFITYSEGCNDDVNKIVWSSLGWNPETPIGDILSEYSRYFIGPRDGETFAKGLAALEHNWRGPLAVNESVQPTLKLFQKLERDATPQERANWRFQQALYRAYYDAYEQDRLKYESKLEDAAMKMLGMAAQVGANEAMRAAQDFLEYAVRKPVAQDLRARVFELAEALFQSIRMQLSVERYQAIDVGRGANLDTIDIPLNNLAWLKLQFAEIRKLDSEDKKLKAINAIVNWTDPGPGGFYDDLGNPSRETHLVRGPGFAEDPTFSRSAYVGFGYRPEWRRSWCSHAEVTYGRSLEVAYWRLDPHASYVLRVVYAGNDFHTRLRLTANDAWEIHADRLREDPVRPVEFAIPAEATKQGNLHLKWSRQLGLGGSGRGCSVAEVWLIKK